MWTTRLWVVGALIGAGYGVFLLVAAAGLPAGADLTGQFPGQPLVKALMAVLLAVAAAWLPRPRERRWLVAALLFSAAGTSCWRCRGGRRPSWAAWALFWWRTCVFWPRWCRWRC